MCGLHIVVHADELEELINYYQVIRLTPVIQSKPKFFHGNSVKSWKFRVSLVPNVKLSVSFRIVATLKS